VDPLQQQRYRVRRDLHMARTTAAGRGSIAGG
jgi:hypothetical protein